VTATLLTSPRKLAEVAYSTLYDVISSPPSHVGELNCVRSCDAETVESTTLVGGPGVVIGLLGAPAACGSEYPTLLTAVTRA